MKALSGGVVSTCKVWGGHMSQWWGGGAGLAQAEMMWQWWKMGLVAGGKVTGADVFQRKILIWFTILTEHRFPDCFSVSVINGHVTQVSSGQGLFESQVNRNDVMLDRVQMLFYVQRPLCWHGNSRRNCKWNLSNCLFLRVIRSLVRHVKYLLGLRFEVSGWEHLQTEGPYVVISNHQSSLDVLGACSAVWRWMWNSVSLISEFIFFLCLSSLSIFTGEILLPFAHFISSYVTPDWIEIDPQSQSRIHLLVNTKCSVV